MTAPGWLWLARQELRLSWRDLVALATAGRRGREWVFVTVIAGVALLLHLPAWGFAAVVIDLVATAEPVVALAAITMVIGLAFAVILSQAIEQVTRAFYTRGDMELILSAPLPPARVLGIRIAASAGTSALLPLVLVAPLADCLAVRDGPAWLAAYPLLLALGVLATALAVVIAAGLFRLIGPRRTRLVAQIIAALVGAGFVLTIQIAAMSSGSEVRSPTDFLSDPAVTAGLPPAGSLVWIVARAATGDLAALGAVIVAAIGLLVAAIALFSRSFAAFALSAGNLPTRRAAAGRSTPFRRRTPGQVLRRKEWALLRRDPWLLSQTLVPLLYLVPPAVMLWQTFERGSGVPLVTVPFLVMAAGQLAGGLAWVAVSAEDAPDLVASAPISGSLAFGAKVEAVLAAIAAVFALPIVVLLVLNPVYGAAAAVGVAASALSATRIQLWFRTESKRSDFRRRFTASRLATFTEAFSSLGWAGTAALLALGTWLAVINLPLALGALAIAWFFSPARRMRARATPRQTRRTA